jgi:FAD/FMN-containing dehydrogenase
MADLLTQLIETFGAESVWHGAELAGRSASYLENQPFKARALLRPASTAEVAEMLRLCSAAGQPVIPQGGLSNLVYSTFTTESDVALSLERMNRVEEIDPLSGTMTVQTGATLLAVQQAAEAAGLFFPLDLPARQSAVIGGLIGTNAGGLRVVRYGMMREMLLGLEAVLADGTILNMLNKMLKKNAGYDLKQLFIGSEGTLGVATRAVLRLWPPQPAAGTALLALERFEQVANLLVLAKNSLGGQLSSFEVLWNDFYRLTTTPPAPAAPPLRSDAPYYVLVESLGQEPAEEHKRMEDFLVKAKAMDLYTEAVMAHSPAQRAALWKVREDTQQIEAQVGENFGFDVSLPINCMANYVEHFRRELDAAFGPLKVWIFGHLADGNLHIHVWGEQLDLQNDADRVERIIYTPLQALGGSISAEHGIGLRKKPYLLLSRTPEEIATMRQLKATLDPRGILNPGKVFDV